MESFNDKVINFVIELAKRHLNPAQVIIFGSRARGDNHERSDYDFAIRPDVTGFKSDSWTLFLTELDENQPTLLNIDVIDLSIEVSDLLREQILKDGKILLENKNETLQLL